MELESVSVERASEKVLRQGRVDLLFLWSGAGSGVLCGGVPLVSPLVCLPALRLHTPGRELPLVWGSAVEWALAKTSASPWSWPQ
jgi:hypothetical protein